MDDFNPPLIAEIVDQNIGAIEGIDNALQIIVQDAEIATIPEITTVLGINDDDDIVGQDAQIDELEGDADDYIDVSGTLLGITRGTVEDMHTLYRRHARANGFSVRKGTNRFSTTGILLGKDFVCSNNGLKKARARKTTKNGNMRKEKMVGITRTDCKAMMSVKLNQKGVFEVVKHEREHNHQLTRPEWGHHHRSERGVTEVQGILIEQMLASGIKPAECYQFMANEAGGQEQLGYTKVDHYNFISREKLVKIESGDAQTFLDMIIEENKQDQEFFYKVKLDSESRLACIFWRDSQMKEDYSLYGDVVVFDTTYRTNKYDLICAPFVGINNHWKNVMFACAFICEEKQETFEWLFIEFRKSMGGKYPISIFTDQDMAISNGIKEIFPEARHRLCLWHLQQNAIARFGNLKKEDAFKDAFNKCLSGCKDDSEFETTWKEMVSTYGLQENSWFKRVYALKEKWCTTLSKNFFSAGIRSSQRSESTNNALGRKARKDTSLTDFYKFFKDTVKNWREEEVKDEFYCSKTIPESNLRSNVSLVRHASEVYTPAIFRDFEDEYSKSLDVAFKEVQHLDTMKVYEVGSFDGGSSNTVMFDSAMMLIKCDCMNFEECGILCYHCLRILNINSVQKIPDVYILKRWTKLAKSLVWDKLALQGNKKESIDETIWKDGMLRKTYSLILLSKGNEAARAVLEESNKRDFITISALVSTEMIGIEQEETSVQSTSSRTIMNPNRSITKGRRKRKKGYLEKSKNKRTSSSQSAPTLEFGSRTPNPRLI